MKKIISIFLSVVMLFSITTGLDFSAFALSNSGYCGDNITYTFDSYTGELVIDGVGEMYDFESYNSAPWYDYIKKSYGNSSTSATKVVINEGITSIGSYAFSYCNCSVELPSTLSTVNPNAFYHAFEYIDGYELWLPDGLTHIGQYAFYYSNVARINFPRTLKTIGKNAFYGCDKLKTIELNNGLENIYDYAFSKCTSLEEVIIPNSITKIPNCCFSNCQSLSKIQIPDSVTTIEYRAFEGCSSLEYIDLPSKLTYISRYLFYKCDSLKEIILPDTVNSIGWDAFNGCKKLKYVKLNENLSWIESSAFYNCYNLKAVVIPSLTTYYESSSSFGKGDDPITGEEYVTISDFTLYCFKGSKAESSAIKYGTNYKTIDLKIDDKYAYNDNPVVPSIEIRIGDVLLEENTDYVIECTSNETIGTANVKISFVGDYAFLPNIVKEFEICNDFLKCKVSLDKEKYQYHQKLPEITVKNNEEELICGIDYEIEYTIDGKTWIKNNDAYNYNWGVGTGIAVVKGIGAYVGKQVFEFKIEKFDMANAHLMTPWVYSYDGTYSSQSFSIDDFEYDDSPKKQQNFRVCDDNNEISTYNYEIKYKNNTNAGEASLIIEGKGDYYCGSLVKNFNIISKDIANISCEKIGDKVYTGSPITPNMLIKDGSKTLKKNVDYIVSYSNNIKVGNASIIINGIGNYAGTKIVYYKIVPAKPTNITLSATSYVYDGKVKTPSVVIKNSVGKTLIKNSDYTISYSNGRKNVGKYTVKIAFKGNYSGTVSKSFTIVPKTTSISSLTAASKGFTVKWKKQATQTTGYQIQIATDSKFTKGVKSYTLTKNSTVSKKITKLTGKKKYYVRIRTYKTVSGTKYYSAWSGNKSVTTKK